MSISDKLLTIIGLADIRIIGHNTYFDFLTESAKLNGLSDSGRS